MDNGIPVIGLTGGIGTGKSTVAAILKQRGFLHIDADQIGRDITSDGSEMLEVLNENFGPKGDYGVEGVEILTVSGGLDRRALASIVFTDIKKKNRLDEIMFEKIISEVDRLISNMSSKNSLGILLDAPLLFEAGLEGRCDVVLLITADEDVRIERVCKRDGVTPEDVKHRITSQMGDNEKKKKADIIIDNSGTRAELEIEIEKVMKLIKKNNHDG